MPDVAETFADVFFFPTARPSKIGERLIPIEDAYPAHKIDEDFSLEELRRAPDM